MSSHNTSTLLGSVSASSSTRSQFNIGAIAKSLGYFASKHGTVAIDRMRVEDLKPEIIRTFLDHLERDRQCSGVTRNQRLAT